MTAIITLRMSKDFLRPGLVSSEKISPTRANPSSPSVTVRIEPDVAVDGIGGHSPPRESARPAPRKCVHNGASRIWQASSMSRAQYCAWPLTPMMRS